MSKNKLTINIYNQSFSNTINNENIKDKRKITIQPNEDQNIRSNEISFVDMEASPEKNKIKVTNMNSSKDIFNSTCDN